MKFSVNQDKFKKFFQVSGKCISPKDIRPVLQCVKVSVEGNELTIVATDMDNVVKMKFDCDGFEDGSCMLPTKVVNKLLSVSEDDILSFESDGEHLTIRGDRSFYKLPMVDGEDFPDFDQFDFSKCHEVQATDLLAAFERTMFAIDNENSKFALSGVCVSCTEDNLTTVATDGHRCSIQEINAGVVDGHFNEENKTIVSLKTIVILKAILQAVGGTVDVRVDDERIFFAVGDCRLSARLIAGRFPKWKNIVPQLKDRVQVNLMAGSFAQAVKQAQIVTTELQPGIYLNFTKGKLIVKASGSDKGDSEIELPIAYDSDDFSIKLDPVYLLQGLSVLPKEAIISVWLKEKNSLYIDGGDSYSYVLMPLS